MADERITELTALTAPALTDLLAIVDDPSGSPVAKKITVENLFSGLVPDAAGLKPASDSATAIQLQEADGTVVLNVDTSNKRIGINATDPGSLMEVRGDAGAAGILTLATAETTVVDGDVLGQIDFQAPKEASGTDAIVVGASIYAEADDTFAADNNATELVFATASSGAVSEQMRIASDGKMGIGTPTPGSNQKVHIVESDDEGTPSLGSGGVTIQNNKFSNYNAALTIIAGSAADSQLLFGDKDDQDAGEFSFDHSSNAFRWLVAASEKARIESDGDMGVGSNSPSAQLHVDQTSTTGAQPVLLLDQADVSEEFIRFIGSAANGTLTQSIVDEGDQGGETREGWLKVYVQDDGNQITDQAYFIPIYSLSA